MWKGYGGWAVEVKVPIKCRTDIFALKMSDNWMIDWIVSKSQTGHLMHNVVYWHVMFVDRSWLAVESPSYRLFHHKGKDLRFCQASAVALHWTEAGQRIYNLLVEESAGVSIDGTLTQRTSSGSLFHPRTQPLFLILPGDIWVISCNIVFYFLEQVSLFL